MEQILNVTGLNKSYRNFALRDITFSLPEGCITGLIGVNGAGKTTTLRAILRLATRTSGQIRLFGMDLDNSEQQIKQRLGIVLDNGGFYDDLSLAEMKSIVAPAYKSWSDTDFRSYMDRFSLNPKQHISTLSKGMRMKYALALALSHKAEFLIMDEPTSGLDPLIRSQLLDILKEYMEKGGKGVLFSTHITSDLDKIADILIMIDNGKIVFQEDKDTLLDSYRIVKGNVRELTTDARSLIFNLSETSFGFTGLTNQMQELKTMIPDLIMERPTVEDIMLANIKGGRQ